MAETVRSPIRNDAVREPNVAVNRRRAPHTRHIQIGDADDTGRNSPDRYGMREAGVALRAPSVELVGIRHGMLIVGGGIPFEDGLLVVV